jgi:acetylornithine/N-succinyldiaminopimelate aminotransferase
VCCAGALNVLSRIDEKLLERVKQKSRYIINELTGAEGILGVTGMGLMLGVETKADVSKVITECMKRGVMPIKAKNKVRIVPALNIPDELLRNAVEIIKKVCGEVCG